MQQIKLETNELGLKVFINGVPDISLMPEETKEGFLRTLEREIAEYGLEGAARKGTLFDLKIILQSRVIFYNTYDSTVV